MSQNSQRERIQDFILDTYGTEAEHLWARYPNFSVFRHSGSKKWYAIIMDVAGNKVGLDTDQTYDVMNIKCDPLMIGSLLLEKGFVPAYHMNKSSWISILLDESVSDEAILPLIGFSYDSVAPKRKKAK